jgi:hypothetical protein
MFQQMQQIRGVSGSEMNRIREIFARLAERLDGAGQPGRHPASAHARRGRARLGGSVSQVQESYRNRQYERICGERYMVPLYDPATQSPSDATVCADMFEYPNIPMVYPVVWVRANEAAQLCAAEGKRMGDAHEWEGASAGQLLPPDYPFDRVRGMSGSAGGQHDPLVAQQPLRLDPWHLFDRRLALGRLRHGQLQERVLQRRQLHRLRVEHLSGRLLPGVPQPAGRLRHRRQRGRAHEPAASEDQMASRGSTTLGVTEMKGSWFIWDTIRAHEHWSRWRAPFWHGSRVMSEGSHRNYHLGFRCFRDI